MTNWEEIRKQIAQDRGIYCQNCECVPWTELHHCLIHRMKNKPELDCVENLMAVYQDCHAHSSGYPVRLKFWKSQCALYGEDRMREWLNGLNLKIKPRYE